MESSIASSKGAKAFGGSVPLSRVAGVEAMGMQAVEVAGEQQSWRDAPSSVLAVGSAWWGATILAFCSRIPSLEVARICIEAN
jgi:hypothetical protein